MTYKIMKKLSQYGFWGKFQLGSLQSNYATRYCGDLNIPRINTEHLKKVLTSLLSKPGMTFQLILENSRLFVTLKNYLRST